MSYCRNPYIFPTTHGTVSFEGKEISSEHIDIFLYVMTLIYRRDELKQRLQQGKSLLVEFNKEDQEYLEWLEENEDELVKSLMK